MSKLHPLFEGEPVLLDVSHRMGYGRQMLVTPGITLDSGGLQVGIYAKISDIDSPNKVENVFFWGMVTPRNIIAYWRATLILAKMKFLESDTLCLCYYSAARNPHQSDMDKVTSVQVRVGHKTYDKIMATPIPDEIIQIILDHQDDEQGWPLDLWPITQEVEAGTLAWRQEFADIGVKHPDTVRAEKAARQAIIARYERYLQAYATAHDLDRNCFLMGSFEGALIQLVQDGYETLERDIFLGVAIAMAHGGIAHTMGALGMGWGTPPSVQQQEMEGIAIAAKWLPTQFRQPHWLFFTKPVRSYADYNLIIGETLVRIQEAFEKKHQKQPA